MSTKTKNAKGVQGTTAAKATGVKTENRPNITGKEAKEDRQHEPAKDEKPAQAAEVKATQTAENAPVSGAAENHQSANPAEQPEQREVKTEEAPKGEIRYIKPAPNLELTIKAVDTLHRKTIQRLALLARIKTLEAFEVKLVEEADELNDNPFQGCKLIIEDDKKRQFVTATPGLIRMVSQYIFDACHEKLAEIEAEIVFPNA